MGNRKKEREAKTGEGRGQQKRFRSPVVLLDYHENESY